MMKISTKLAFAFMALAGASSAANATGPDDMGSGRHGPRAQLQFGASDADSSGDVTFEEFAAAMQTRVGSADKDGDGKMTVEEITDEIVRMRAERQAKRIVERFDIDGDGAVTAAEIESRQKKMFALLDRNDDGKIVKDEMPRRGERGGWHIGRRNH